MKDGVRITEQELDDLSFDGDRVVRLVDRSKRMVGMGRQARQQRHHKSQRHQFRFHSRHLKPEFQYRLLK